jgi:hypothetical protein
MVSNVGGPRFPQPVLRLAQSTHLTPSASAAKAVARSSDPLPTFKTAEAYKNYVINLVSQSRASQQALEEARKAQNAGTGVPGAVGNAQERLDSVKLELAVLRDNFVPPAEWARSSWLGGQGFDKDKFWQAQVEAIPGKEVVVSPKPVAPAAPPVPAPAPAQSAPAPAQAAPAAQAAPVAPGNGNYAASLALASKYASDALNVSSSYKPMALKAFHQAADQCASAADALKVAETAAKCYCTDEASYAFGRALGLAGNAPEALTVGVDAANYGQNLSSAYTPIAVKAFMRAGALAKNAAEAFEVAKTAANLATNSSSSYKSAATTAFTRAIDLSSDATQVMKISDSAKGFYYTAEAAHGMDRALTLAK